jgi:hypothetical protein
MRDLYGLPWHGRGGTNTGDRAVTRGRGCTPSISLMQSSSVMPDKFAGPPTLKGRRKVVGPSIPRTATRHQPTACAPHGENPDSFLLLCCSGDLDAEHTVHEVQLLGRTALYVHCKGASCTPSWSKPHHPGPPAPVPAAHFEPCRAVEAAAASSNRWVPAACTTERSHSFERRCEVVTNGKGKQYCVKYSRNPTPLPRISVLLIRTWSNISPDLIGFQETR